jgi:nucleoside-triphosphatase THEP1
MKIVIAGARGEGKTTIARLIVEALEKAGIFVKDVNDEDYLASLSNKDLQEKRLNSLKRDLNVVVESIQIVMPGYDSRDTKNARPGLFTARNK